MDAFIGNAIQHSDTRPAHRRNQIHIHHEGAERSLIQQSLTRTPERPADDLSVTMRKTVAEVRDVLGEDVLCLSLPRNEAALHRGRAVVVPERAEGIRIEVGACPVVGNSLVDGADDCSARGIVLHAIENMSKLMGNNRHIDCGVEERIARRARSGRCRSDAERERVCAARARIVDSEAAWVVVVNRCGDEGEILASPTHIVLPHLMNPGKHIHFLKTRVVVGLIGAVHRCSVGRVDVEVCLRNARSAGNRQVVVTLSVGAIVVHIQYVGQPQAIQIARRTINFKQQFLSADIRAWVEHQSPGCVVRKQRFQLQNFSVFGIDPHFIGTFFRREFHFPCVAQSVAVRQDDFLLRRRDTGRLRGLVDVVFCGPRCLRGRKLLAVGEVDVVEHSSRKRSDYSAANRCNNSGILDSHAIEFLIEHKRLLSLAGLLAKCFRKFVHVVVGCFVRLAVPAFEPSLRCIL